MGALQSTMYEERRDSVVSNLTPEHSTGSNGIYRFEKTRLVPGAPDHTLDFLPHYFEAKILVHEYIKQLSYIQDKTPNFENPSCHSADMSYFVERLHLATTAKANVDHMNSLTLTSIPIDPELKIDPNLVIDSTSPFLRLSTYDRAPKDRFVFIQVYLLHSLTQAQCCHFNFANLGSLESRKKCYISAHANLDAERLVQHSQHRFVRIHFHLAATLGALFIACIVLFMETCVSNHISFEPNLEQGDMADVLKFLEETKKHSVAAQKVWQGLNGVIERFREKHMNRDIGRSVMTEKDMWERTRCWMQNAVKGKTRISRLGNGLNCSWICGRICRRRFKTKERIGFNRAQGFGDVIVMASA
jgi:hypothetical protein